MGSFFRGAAANLFSGNRQDFAGRQDGRVLQHPREGFPGLLARQGTNHHATKFTKGYSSNQGPKPAASASRAPSTPAARVPASTPAAPAPAAPAPAPASTQAVPATPTPAGAGDQAAFNDPSALTMGTDAENAINQMENMGFARADAERAMRAAFFNPDRAIEYLLTVNFSRTFTTFFFFF